MTYGCDLPFDYFVYIRLIVRLPVFLFLHQTRRKIFVIIIVVVVVIIIIDCVFSAIDVEEIVARTYCKEATPSLSSKGR